MPKSAWSLCGLLLLLVGATVSPMRVATGDNNLPTPATRKIAQTNAADGAAREKSGKSKGAAAITPEREAAAMTFVKLHHPDLADLLGHLKESNPREYQRAIRELFRTSENLALTQESDARKYELDLQAWRLKSRIQLLAARLSMSHTKALEEELRKALAEQVELRIRQQELLRERMSARLQEVDAQITKLNQERQERVERDLAQILLDVGVRPKTQTGTAPDERGEKSKKTKSETVTKTGKETK